MVLKLSVKTKYWTKLWFSGDMGTTVQNSSEIGYVWSWDHLHQYKTQKTSVRSAVFSEVASLCFYLSFNLLVYIDTFKLLFLRHYFKSNVMHKFFFNLIEKSSFRNSYFQTFSLQITWLIAKSRC